MSKGQLLRELHQYLSAIVVSIRATCDQEIARDAADLAGKRFACLRCVTLPPIPNLGRHRAAPQVN